MDLDFVVSEIGEFGKFQVRIYTLLFFPLAFSAMTGLSYIFTAGDIEYRCVIPECEINNTFYKEPWLSCALPYKNGKLESHCKRYKSIDSSYHQNCTENIFIRGQIEECHSFVFKDNENTIIKEFNLLCEENYWKKALVGTLSNAGEFIGTPLAGVFSDRFGRKTMIITGVLCSAIAGTLKSFAYNYIQFVVCEVANAIAVGGIYAGTFIYGIELTGPKKRALGGIILCTYFSIGEVILGIIVWLVNDWRAYLRIINIPALIIISYYWIIPESIRWQVTYGKREKLIKTLEKISSINNKPMTENIKKSVGKIENIQCKGIEGSENVSMKDGSKNPVKQVIKSKIMLMRVLACSFCWIIIAFVYYGLSLSSTTVIEGNKYLNFILTCFMEIPGELITWLVIDTLGRKWSFAGSLITSGSACTMFHFIDPDTQVMRLLLFLVGKCAITVAFSALYVHASEYFPTNLRHSLIGFCSTIGRAGSVIAPNTALLAVYIDPVLIFGASSLVAGAVALHFPETMNCKLPDTVAEAEELGRGSKQRQEQHSSYKNTTGVSY